MVFMKKLTDGRRTDGWTLHHTISSAGLKSKHPLIYIIMTNLLKQ